ncbi:MULTISPECIES: hypothetical protein [unclassified Streptomyces]|uniref:hypothetical protein n=1 Tax=unclassified Streptomyces TaxID=2593676 RepID=UPI002255DD07|nr:MULTISPECIES: hypothetical protein [unclassified Streptomyces]MCX5334654.1 hypothetical protein [Streptomyces sp. NBC_00140]MCX5364148.1 hypothetical protein [Streptomyces sp. NBC_00124]
MTFGDQGTPYGAADPYTQWVVEQERIRRRRRTRRAVAAGTGAVLVAAIAAGAVLYTGGDGDGEAAAPPSAAASVTASLPSDAPSALPSLLSRPVIRPEQAFPAKSVRLGDGSRYERVDLATTTDCSEGMSPELAALIQQGQGCERLTAALFTDTERRSQVTVTVLSFRTVQDASKVFAMASMDPVTYQVVSLDPPPEAGLPTVPPGSAGVFRRLMTVRSVVFANGQWGDGAETDEAAITKETEDLLQYADDNVVAYEDPSSV